MGECGLSKCFRRQRVFLGMGPITSFHIGSDMRVTPGGLRRRIVIMVSRGV